MNSSIISSAINNKDYQSNFDKGIDYETYMNNFLAELESKVESKNSHYLPINLQRTKRITKTIHISDELKAAINSLTDKINWLAISEHWCGDSAQILPVINTIVKASDNKIDFKIVYRDNNQELMNAHLTNGSMSIPILIQLDSNFNLTGTFGPRPNEVQQLVKELKSNPETASTYSEKLHKWYADDKTISIQKELTALLQKATNL